MRDDDGETSIETSAVTLVCDLHHGGSRARRGRARGPKPSALAGHKTLKSTALAGPPTSAFG